MPITLTRPIKTVLSTLLVFACSNAPAESTSTTKEGQLAISYDRVYADSNGTSHFGKGQLTVIPDGHELHKKSTGRDYLLNLDGGKFYFVPANEYADFHSAPQRELVFVIKGSAEIVVSDGEAREFGPGDIVMIEDMTGQGHSSRTKDDQILFIIPWPLK